MFYKVAISGLKIPLLTYSSSSEIKIGSLVEVDLKNKRWLGTVWQKEVVPPAKDIKEIREVLSPGFFSIPLLRFYNFVSKYYFVYPGEVLFLVFPGIKKISGKIRSFFVKEVEGEKPLISDSGVYLFVGKKEEERIRILLRRMEKRKGTFLYLFPEIVQAERVFARLKKQMEGVIFYHSQLKRKERIRIWSEINRGKYRVIIGLRQAIFLPIPNLIGIAVDEEENQFYKEEKKHFHYQARDCAIIRGRIENIPVYLFSHTPSLESFYYSQKKIYKLYGEFKKKDVKIIIVDMRKKEEVLSDVLKKFLVNYRESEVFYLLVQRRGFSRYVICTDCGFIPRCSLCGFPFFYHQKESILSCHICGKKEQVFDECPNCRSVNFLFKGIGIERVEQELKVNFPWLQSVLTKKRGIFLGQSFGADIFPEDSINLVGIISFEQLFSFSDFRTEEWAFRIVRSLIEKLKEGGFLIIQTKNPSQSIFSQLFNPHRFFTRLLKEREDFFLPPFSSIAALKIFHNEEMAVRKYEELKKILAPLGEKIKIFPPFKSFRKKRGKYHYNILLKAESGLRFYNILKKENLFIGQEEIEVDINPITILT